MPQQIYLVSDHAGFDLKKNILEYLKSLESFGNSDSYIISDLTPTFLKNDDYPDKARVLALAMEDDDEAIGIALCGSGVGINIALNRYKHVRAILGDAIETVQLSRADNNTNVLCLGERVLEKEEACKLVKTFLETKFNSEERHLRRIQKIS